MSNIIASNINNQINSNNELIESVNLNSHLNISEKCVSSIFHIEYSTDLDDIDLNEDISNENCPICLLNYGIDVSNISTNLTQFDKSIDTIQSDQFNQSDQLNQSNQITIHKLKQMSCKHIFHKECINKWFEMSGSDATCPYCQMKINSHSEIKTKSINALSEIIDSYESITDMRISTDVDMSYICDKCAMCIPEIRYHVKNINYDLCLKCYEKYNTEKKFSKVKFTILYTNCRLPNTLSNNFSSKLNKFYINDMLICENLKFNFELIINNCNIYNYNQKEKDFIFKCKHNIEFNEKSKSILDLDKLESELDKLKLELDKLESELDELESESDSNSSNLSELRKFIGSDDVIESNFDKTLSVITIDAKSITMTNSVIMSKILFLTKKISLYFCKIYDVTQLEDIFNFDDRSEEIVIEHLKFRHEYDKFVPPLHKFTFNSYLKNLKEITIHMDFQTNIKDIPIEFADSIENMTFIGIKFKKMFNLPKKLKTLYIEKTICETVDNISFAGLNDLKQIEIYQIYINTVTDLPNTINQLTITNCQLKQISNLPTSLEYLNLSDNKLEFGSEFESNFKNLNQLTTMNLSYNKIKNIYICPTINKINVSHNKITKLSNTEFSTNLTDLNLSYNLLSEIPPLNDLLKYFYASNNKLSGEIIFGTMIKIISVSNNKLTSITLTSCENLENMNCENNQIKEIKITGFMFDNELKGTKFHNLNELNVCRNKLKILPNIELSKNSLSISLKCSKNYLTTIPNLYYNKLYCDHNLLETLTLDKTIKINCSYNKIKILKINYMNILNCSHNKLIELEYQHFNLTLKCFRPISCSINCSYNPLTKLNVSDVHSLNCSHTKLIDKIILSPHIYKLDISNTSIPEFNIDTTNTKNKNQNLTLKYLRHTKNDVFNMTYVFDSSLKTYKFTNIINSKSDNIDESNNSVINTFGDY